MATARGCSHSQSPRALGSIDATNEIVTTYIAVPNCKHSSPIREKTAWNGFLASGVTRRVPFDVVNEWQCSVAQTPGIASEQAAQGALRPFLACVAAVVTQA